MDNCKNQTLKVAVLDHSGFHLKKIGEKWTGVDGRDFEILRVLSDKMVFRYEFVSPTDKQWGSCDNRGNCTGIIGMVARREADMGISSLSPTAARAKYVDFSTSYCQDEVTFVTRKPETLLLKSVFFTKPFESQVWISVACFLTVFVAMTKILEFLKLLQPKLFSVKRLIAILLRQDASLKSAPKESRSLIIVASLLLLAGCADKMYECVLTSETSLTSNSRPLDKLEDILDAIKKQDYNIGAIHGSSTYYQVMNSDLEYLKIFANSIRKKGSETHGTAKEGLIKTLKEKYATIGSKTGLRKHALAAGLDLSKFHFASDYLFLDQFAIAYGRKFRFKDALNKCLVVMAGSDLMTKWEMKINWRMNKEIVTHRPNEKYIDFNDLKLVLVGVVIGYAFASTVLIVELTLWRVSKLYSVWRNKINR